ncbi:MAG: flagellar hook capping protein [Proteobacteria bacterium]|nr:flagellar hook capping protein [Pseudomonadota bacterium]
MAISAVSAATADASVGAGRTRLAENFETFLSLLTTQLKNQDPLAPMDGNQFTQQLVQMTGVEQQLLSNQLLTSLVNKGSDAIGSAVNLIGKEVTADKSTAEMSRGVAKWSYELPEDAHMATVEVRNAAGQVVKSWDVEGQLLAKGRHGLAWDGTVVKDGVVLPDKATSGTYTLTVKAWAPNGKPLEAPVNTVGTVTAVESIDGEPWLSVGSAKIPMKSITSVRASAPVETKAAA